MGGKLGDSLIDLRILLGAPRAMALCGLSQTAAGPWTTLSGAGEFARVWMREFALGSPQHYAGTKGDYHQVARQSIEITRVSSEIVVVVQ